MTYDLDVTLPSSLGSSSNYVFTVLEPVSKLAECEIDATLEEIDKCLAKDPRLKLRNWSMQISQAGIELMSCPLEEWLQSDDWCYPGYLHEFQSTDTLEWFRSIIVDNRHSLGRMLVAYAIRDAGYGLTKYPSGFEDALMRQPPKPPISLDFDATLELLDREYS